MATRGTRGALAVLMMTAAMTGTGWAQEDGVWVQIEALPTLAQAQQRARLYANNLPDVNGYFLGGRWYGVALGPYAPDDATRVLNQLRARDAIPDDSYIVDGDRFRTQFYPVGTGAQTAPRDLPDGIEATAPEAHRSRLRLRQRPNRQRCDPPRTRRSARRAPPRRCLTAPNARRSRSRCNGRASIPPGSMVPSAAAPARRWPRGRRPTATSRPAF